MNYIPNNYEALTQHKITPYQHGVSEENDILVRGRGEAWRCAMDENL